MRRSSLPAFVLLFAASSAPRAEVSSAPAARITLPDLESMEYDRPDDPLLKLDLAQHYWCRGERGLAFEHWRWLLNTSAPVAKEARRLLASVQQDPQLVSQDCAPDSREHPVQDYPQKPR